ncbi:hypothetical protein ACGK9U_00910 [Mariniflexile sp. HNIBRBA6329]|uniref:DUF7833 domain-containing protein n=1 Tax=Mariniflexile sp. HNIBRBA6329 TaxID=3373088 RepID=UPI003745EB0A
MKPRLNYIEQINSFWKHALTDSFKSKEIALYFYLLHVNNSCNWKKSFSHNNKKIEAFLDVSFKTLVMARKNLKNAGLIDFKTKNGSPNVNYEIKSFSKFPEVWEEDNDKAYAGVKEEISKTKNKLNNIKRVDDDVYASYSKMIEENEQWRNSIYSKYKLQKGSLKKLVEDFVLSLKTYSKEPHNTYDDFIKHFVNWLNSQEKNNKLDSVKKNVKIGGI